MPARPATLPRRSSAGALALALALGAAAGAAAQSAAPSDDELFGEETVTEAAAPDPTGATPVDSFLAWDEVRVGGSISGSLGLTASWDDPWGGAASLLEPDANSLDPSLSGKVSLVAKPSADFGVNIVFKTSWPFSTIVDDPAGDVAVPAISVWAFYSKFSWKDSLFFSFGKQPLAWGVAKGFFQPADDIFALSAVSIEDTGAEREGPIVFKAHYPVPLTRSNVYFYAGVPDVEDITIADARLALKAEFSAGNTEVALGGYYSYDDHPRAILMGTTGTGDFNFYGEAILKYGSERVFLVPGMPVTAGPERDSDFFFSGTIGGYYTDQDANLTLAAQYFFNGEGQTEVSAAEAMSYYVFNSDDIDRMAFGRHYAYAMVSKSELFTEKLSASLIALANLEDFSGFVMPSLSWEFFDYASVKLGANFSFGGAGDEYTLRSGGTPGASVTLSATLGSGSF